MVEQISGVSHHQTIHPSVFYTTLNGRVKRKCGRDRYPCISQVLDSGANVLIPSKDIFTALFPNVRLNTSISNVRSGPRERARTKLFKSAGALLLPVVPPSISEEHVCWDLLLWRIRFKTVDPRQHSSFPNPPNPFINTKPKGIEVKRQLGIHIARYCL